METVRRSYALPAALAAGAALLLSAYWFGGDIASLLPNGSRMPSVASIDPASLRMPFIQRADGAFVAQTFAGRVKADATGIHYDLVTQTDAQGKQSIAFKESLVGASDIGLAGEGANVGTVNVYHGDDASKWQVGLRSYKTVDFTQPWDGIGMTLVAHGDNVEKVFTVEPGTDPSAIAIAVEGATSISVEKNGELKISTLTGDMSLSAPVAYQEIGGKKVSVPVSYAVRGSEYGFTVGAYDTAHALVIDPVIASTYFGGSWYESGEGDNQTTVAVDGEGNVYLYGVTESQNLPVTDESDLDGDAAQDVFVAKFSPDLEDLLAASYIGGTWYDYQGDMAVSDSGYVYLTGQTYSSDFPMNDGSIYDYNDDGDAFVIALDSDDLGLITGTYYGGTANDYGTAIDIGSAVESEEIYIGGNTYSGESGEGAISLPMEGDSFATTTTATEGGSGDGFVAAFNFNGSALTHDYSTFLDMTEAYLTDLKVSDLDESVVISGTTANSDMPASNTYSDNYEGFVAKLPLDLSDLNGIYLGDASDDWATGIALEDGETGLAAIYAVGDTRSQTFPVTDSSTLLRADDYGHDVFVAKLDPDLDDIDAATFLNSYGNDGEAEVALDGGDVFVGAYSDSYNYYTDGFSPVTANALNPRGDEKVMIARYDSDLTLEAATYFGGDSTNRFGGMTFNALHRLIVSGVTWAYEGFPVSPDAFQPFHAIDDGSSDAFVSILSRDLLASCGDGYRSYMDDGEDGFVSGEECDDGNTSNGDGCSSSCHVEDGFTCGDESPSLCSKEECAPDAFSSFVYGGHCYAGYNNDFMGATWSEAQTSCDAAGGTLVSVTGLQESRIMGEIWNNAAGDVWIGLNDLGEEGYLEWDGGESVGFQRWQWNEPANNEEKDCIESSWGGAWGFQDCEVTRYYACEYDTDVCGNGFLFAADEECDDGNDENGDGCSSSCEVESGYTCSGLPSECQQLCNPNADEGDDYLAVGDKCLVAFEQDATWDDAETTCNGIDGHLVAVENEDQNDAVGDFADDFGNIWIGGTDVEEEGTFVWVGDAGTFWSADIQEEDIQEDTTDESDGAIDGVFTDWNEGEPNNYVGEDGSENCVEFTGEGFWNDNNCGVERSYVCELPNILYVAPSSSSSSSAGEEESSAGNQGGGGGRRGGGGGGAGHPTNAQVQSGQTGAAEGASSSNGRGEPLKVSNQTFKDVYSKDWFSTYVRKMVEKKIFTGYKDDRGKSLNLYGPADPITMGQLAKVAAVIADKKVTENVGGDWAAPYLDEAKKAKLTAFLAAIDQNAKATRGAVVQTLLEALGIPLDGAVSSFPDVPAGHPYAAAIATAKKLGIVSGDAGKDTFRPNDPVNRAEVAKMITLALAL